MTSLQPTRGRVYWVELGDVGRKPFLVVSNNSRNRNLRDCLAVRLTTTRRSPRTTIVPLGPADQPLHGWALCDEITLLYAGELLEDVGALSRVTMASIETGLKDALNL